MDVGDGTCGLFMLKQFCGNLFTMKQKLLISFIRHNLHPVKKRTYCTIRVRLKAVPHTMVTATTVAQHYQS
jgi:hypothetical protein